MGKRLVAVLFVCLTGYGCVDDEKELIVPPGAPTSEKSSPPIEPFYPVPTPSQLDWQDAEIVMFLHFGVNTFTDKEWGDGTEDPALFAPSNLNTGQWVSIAKEIGFRYAILTAKHHDGFCLWPSAFTDHSVARSSYKHGTGDIVREFSDACHSQGIKFAFYLSPWDRHEPSFGTDAYNTYFAHQLTELLSGYGQTGEVWFDGANSDSTRTQVYDWDLFYSTVRHFQPQADIAVLGPDIRWIGNESGLGNETEWCSQPQAFPIQATSSGGRAWWPSECDVSIRPGWFYHQAEDGQLKSVDLLTQIYLQTVGRNSNLLLNVPPNRGGLISDIDVSRLREWRQRLDQIFGLNLFKNQSIAASNVRNNSKEFGAGNCLDENRKTFWAADRDSMTANLTITLKSSVQLDIVRLEEAIEYGQRVSSFSLYYDDGNSWVRCFKGTTIGRSRIVTFSPVQTSRFKIVIESALAPPTLRIVNGYYSPMV